MTTTDEWNGASKWGAMAAVCISVFMSTLDINIVNVALPILVRKLDTDFATIQWVILGYILVVTSMTLSFSRLGDMHGKKHLFALGLGIFTLGSLLCGLSPSAYWLVASRIVQGLGAAMTQALGAAIATEVFPSHERGKAMGIIGSTVSVGLAAGPALGGVLIAELGWRSVFLINIPIGIVAVWWTLKFVPGTVHESRGQTFDFAGSIVMLVLAGSYALGMTLGQRQGFENPVTLGLLFASLAALILFLMIERHSAAPMVDLRLFGNTLFSINLLMGWLVFIVVAATFIIPFYLELVQGYSPKVMGLVMMLVPVSMGVVAPGAGWLADRFGARGITLVGLIVCVAGCLCVASLDGDLDLKGVILRMVPIGVGMGLFQSPNNSAIMGAVPRHRLGLASGLMTLSRTLGHTTGIPLVGTLFTSWTLAVANVPGLKEVINAPPEALVAGLSAVYRGAALIITLATLLAALALYIDHRRHRPKAKAVGEAA